MNNQFDGLTKSMAQSVTRRGALKQFGVGLAGMALACIGLANKAVADNSANQCRACVRKCLRQNPTWTEDLCRAGCFPICGGF